MIRFQIYLQLNGIIHFQITSLPKMLYAQIELNSNLPKMLNFEIELKSKLPE